MPKTIIINNIKIIEFAIALDEKGEFVASIVYSLIDDQNKEFAPRRAALKDLQLTVAQKQGIQNVWNLMLNTVKVIEKI